MDIDKKVDELYNRMFSKYYSGNELGKWMRKTFFGGGNSDLYKSFIKNLLLENRQVKTGYNTSSKVRGYKTFYIFYK